ncbi:MAG: hypothetical protein ACTSYD_08515 [Candidatus Heimdallarchaeaceae archaeon]
MVDDGSSIVVLIIVPTIIIVMIACCIYQSDKRALFAQTALQYIKNYFPYLKVETFDEGGPFSNPRVHALASDCSAPIQSLYIREKTVKRGDSQDSDTEVTAVLNIAESETSGNFIVKIKREGLFNKVFLGENIVLGVKKIDDGLLINGDPPDIATAFLLKNLKFMELLADKYDLQECRLQKFGQKIEFYQRHKRFDSYSLIGALEIIRTLLPPISEKQLAFYKEKAQESTFGEQLVSPAVKIEETEQKLPKIKDEKLVIPIAKEPSPLETAKKEYIQNIETPLEKEEIFCTDEELINGLKKLEHKVDKIEIKESEATTFCESEFFQQINWQWTEDKIKIRAEAKVDEKVQLEIRVKHSITTPTSDFNWFDPLENLVIEVAPEGLQDEFEQSYDIIKCLQKFDKRSITGELHLKSQDGSCVLTLEVEKTQKNVETCFELLEATSWKWLNRFVVV